MKPKDLKCSHCKSAYVKYQYTQTFHSTQVWFFCADCMNEEVETSDDIVFTNAQLALYLKWTK